MVIDFEHHYIPVELARRMGIDTKTKTIVEEGGVAKANDPGHGPGRDRRRGSELHSGMGHDAGKLPVAERPRGENSKRI